MRLSIVTVNYNSYDFLQLLAESIRNYTCMDYEFIIVDNSIPFLNVKSLDCYKYGPHVYIGNPMNPGHGDGLNKGAAAATGEFTMFVDVDCHFLGHSWEHGCIKMLEQFDVLAGRGVPQKPIRPACMIMRSEIAKKYDWRDTPGYRGHRVTPEGYDVAIKAYYQMVADGVNIHMMESCRNEYGTLNGELWSIDGVVPFLYHHWHGAHLRERQGDFPNDDLFKDKELLFSKIPWRLANDML